MKRWAQVDRDEQETHINIDYGNRTITVYTSRKAVYDKLLKRGITPTRVNKIKGEIVGACYRTDLTDGAVRTILSKTILVGGFGVTPRERIGSDLEGIDALGEEILTDAI